MWPEHHVVAEDLERICAAPEVPWQSLHGRTVLVTGATGMIGSALTRALLWYSLTHDAGIRVLAVVRDVARAEQAFASPLAAAAPLTFVAGDVRSFPTPREPVDHVVHGASVTSSRDFVTRPVETIRTAVGGTERVLELARDKGTTSVAYLSSMEVYGSPDGSRRITESTFDTLDPMQVRSSYPESKRMAEALCAAYATEYGVPATVVRLAQTFGPGFALDDARVFVQFARSALEGRDIVLHTAGESEQCYLYTADAVTAVLTVLLAGEVGQAYNAGNETTYCSVRAMAELVASRLGPVPVEVRVDAGDAGTRGYAPTRKLPLDTSRLRALGWSPAVGLEDMYRRMVAAG
ncbi:NAD-dependent epimerase/dehydratase family protein [Cellulomonas aerilata]|uniref:Nucleotide sugar dehydratase n=1 Tax=Cellulomonas aerilata TaxID=515326 RepID=A0A512DEZ9_9CELL|nr:NAD(P)-dependent oxidoreductase [Cellulomonas aerilata]GEO35059.1 nucleotide sugar dehydratase [Cellulomonas aerilata]